MICFNLSNFGESERLTVVRFAKALVANHHILTDILRDEWGYKFWVSDSISLRFLKFSCLQLTTGYVRRWRHGSHLQSLQDVRIEPH